MISRYFIDEDIPIVTGVETVKEVLEKMDDYRIRALPLVEDNKLLAILEQDNLLNQHDDATKIASLPLGVPDYVVANSHWYDAVAVLKKTKLDIVPVLNEELTFLGCIKSRTLLDNFMSMLCFNSRGAILVLYVDIRLYSLADIGRIIESNGAKILSAALFQENNDDKTYLTLKLDIDDVSRVVAGLERFNYIIEARFQHSYFQNADQERLNQLFRYINI
jgi:CBS domain-containing protein